MRIRTNSRTKLQPPAVTFVLPSFDLRRIARVTFLILDIYRRFPINSLGPCAVMFKTNTNVVVLVEFRHYQQLRELFERLAEALAEAHAVWLD
jgi:hypothetical protein